MKALLIVTVAAFSVSVSAQNVSSSTSSGVTTPGHTQVSQSTDAAASRNGVSESNDTAARVGKASASAAQASDVSAELTKKIDSKDAKVGDSVEAKTTSEMRLADGTKLPKGTRLVGHVTEVSRKSSEEKTSHLAFGFDHAILRDGREVPIHAALMSLSAPAPMAASAGAADDSMMAGSGMGAGGGGGMSAGGGGGMRSSGGGGLLGGAGGAVRGTTGLAGGAVNNVATTTGNVGTAATNTVGATAHAGTQGLGAATSGVAETGTQAVGNLQGVTFRSSSDAQSAATLEGAGRNIHLDSGSQMTLAVSASH
jgi:hypothetical protein